MKLLAQKDPPDCLLNCLQGYHCDPFPSEHCVINPTPIEPTPQPSSDCECTEINCIDSGAVSTDPTVCEGKSTWCNTWSCQHNDLPTYTAPQQTAATSSTTISLDIPTMEAMNGVAWLMFIGFGLIILLLAIRAGFMFYNK
jgi:hypothetical protein